MNPVIDCLLSHRSIRKFKQTPIEADKLELILQAGMRAATAGNLQQYSLIVVDDIAKKRLIEDNPAADAPTFIISVVDVYRLKRWFELNEAPFYFDQITSLLIGFWDAIIALHNVVIAAESLGMGTVYMGEVLSMDLATILGIPEYVFPAGMVWVGYPDESPELKPRLPAEAVVHRNGYHIPTDEEIQRFFRVKDEGWKNLSEELVQKLYADGIRNMAQQVTVGHYTEHFINGESKRILENLNKARFKLSQTP